MNIFRIFGILGLLSFLAIVSHADDSAERGAISSAGSRARPYTCTINDTGGGRHSLYFEVVMIADDSSDPLQYFATATGYAGDLTPETLEYVLTSPDEFDEMNSLDTDSDDINYDLRVYFPEGGAFGDEPVRAMVSGFRTPNNLAHARGEIELWCQF